MEAHSILPRSRAVAAAAAAAATVSTSPPLPPSPSSPSSSTSSLHQAAAVSPRLLSLLSPSDSELGSPLPKAEPVQVTPPQGGGRKRKQLPAPVPAPSACPPQLNDSARLRLALSGLHAHQLDLTTVLHLCEEEFLSDAQVVLETELRAGPKKKLHDDTGNLHNGLVYVAVCNEFDIRSKHVESDSDEETERSNEAVPAAAACSSSACPLLSPPALFVAEQSRMPMLGLFAARKYPAGAHVVEYGGTQGELVQRPKQCDSHVRRVATGGWDGRPWSLLYPRIPSALQWEKTLPSSARSHLRPIVTARSFINVLLLLAHERSHSPKLPIAASNSPAFTPHDAWELHVCTGFCFFCSLETRRAHAQHQSQQQSQQVPPLTRDDLTALLLPQCCCCFVRVGLLPCELRAILATWSPEQLVALQARIDRVANDPRGVGYMVNCAGGQKQNVAPLNIRVNDLAQVCVYKAVQDIESGEEIRVRYNTKEEKQVKAAHTSKHMRVR